MVAAARKISALSLGFTLALGIAVAHIGSAAAATTDRIGGANRYETAAQVAGRFGKADAIVIANGENSKQGIDALAANYLAGRTGAPILLTAVDKIDPATISAVKQVISGSDQPTIYVMGAADSVSGAVVALVRSAAASVTTADPTVTRLGGAGRYATAILAASQAGPVANSIDIGAGALTTAFLVSGTVNADALSAGALSAAWGVPVLLTSGTALDGSVQEFMQAQDIRQLIVLGGGDRVSAAVLGAARAAGVVNIKRIAGANRYATAAALYQFAGTTMVNSATGHTYGGTSASGAYLVNGTSGFPDALAAGPLAARDESILLTVAANSLPTEAVSLLGNIAPSTVRALGSPASVSASVLTNAQRAADGLPQITDSGAGSDADSTGDRAGVTLMAGTFTVGSNIKPGRYIATGAAGESGNFFVRGGGVKAQDVNEILGGSIGVPSVTMDLTSGQTIEIRGISEVTFTPATRKMSRLLSTGYWTVGVDAPAGRYAATPAVGESGNFFVRGTDGYSVVNEILGGSIGVPSVTTTLVEGQVIDIRGISTVTLAAVTPHLRTTLTTGTWTVGKDISPGRFVARPLPGESGNFFVRGTDGYSVVNEILGGSYGIPAVTVTLVKGQVVDIRGLSGVAFTPA